MTPSSPKWVVMENTRSRLAENIMKCYVTAVWRVQQKPFISILIDCHEGVDPADFITCEMSCDEFWKVECGLWTFPLFDEEYSKV